MHSPTPRHPFFFLSLLGAFLLLSLPAHAQNELVPNPKAVKLHRVWTHEGQDGVEYEYGYNVSGVPDITGDSINDFAVYRYTDGTWFFYKGGNPPDTIPFWSRDSVGYIPPYVGKFWGDDRRYMLFVEGYGEIIDDFSYHYDRVVLFEVTKDGVSSNPTVAVDQGKKDPPVQRFINEFYAIDANNDSVDDLAVSMGGVRIGHVRTGDFTDQVWFYMGGKNFQLDSPSVVVRDTGYGRPDNWYVRFADFDGDGRLDMVMGGGYPKGGEMLRFYWGDDNSPWSWAERPPDRDVVLKEGESGINGINSVGIYDLNGDGAADLGATIGAGSQAVGRVYLSGHGKDFRSRSFSLEDADWTVNKSVVSSARIGHLNDSANRYEMLPLGGTIASGQLATLGVTATDNGLDHDYEAWYAPGLDGLMNESLGLRRSPIGDVTGDGYEDVILANWQYGVIVHTGIAIVLAGGPYIPFDDTTLSVQEVPVAGDAGGLYLWPNPVIDELNIAWKGNLKKMPARFAVYDMTGKEVVSGPVDTWKGSALWRCASVAAGSYQLTMFDSAGLCIASATIYKQ